MKKLPKELIFTQDFGTYTTQMLVVVGVTDKQKVFRYLKKVKASVDFSKWMLTDFDDLKESITKKNLGLFCWNYKVEGIVLMLREPVDSWNYWEILMHETHHVVQWFAKQKGMFEEPEGQAYLFEYLFHSIRRKLQGIDPI